MEPPATAPARPSPSWTPYDDPNIASDLHQFDVAFSLPDPKFTKVNQNGGSPMPAANAGWASEIALDVEWAHAIAPGRQHPAG